jgi:bacteriocin-like protein
MADDREKLIETGKEPKPLAPEMKDDLSEEDLQKISGGWKVPPD